MMNKNKRLLFIFASFFFLFLFSGTLVFAKDYSITNADFVVQINSDGSADVTETRTYDFDGSFSWADEWIPLTAGINTNKYQFPINTNDQLKNRNQLRSYRIVDFSISEGGTPLRPAERDYEGQSGTYTTNVTDDKFYVKWYYQALNESKTFTLKYKIQNAVTNHSDISEFYWQLIGDEWTKGTGNVKATVYLPNKLTSPSQTSGAEAPLVRSRLSEPEASDVLWGYGHGPLNGKVSIPNNIQVDFSAINLPPKKFFEVRVLFRKLEGAAFAQTGNSSLKEILAEEKAFGDKTRASGILKLALVLGLIAIPIWRLIYWFFVWKKVGDDRPIPQVNLAGILHEPPSDLEPALVEALSSWNMILTTKSIIGTVLNLVRKKVLEIKSEKGKSLFGTSKYSYSLKIKNMKYIVDKKLSDREKELVNFLFISKGKDEMKFSEIKNIGITDRTSAYNFWKKWREKAVDELADLGFLDPKSKKAKDKFVTEIGIILFVLFFLTVLGSGAITVSDVGILLWLSLFGLVFVFVVALIFSPFMYKKTDKGLQEYANWKAFKSYIKDYSVTKNYPIDSVILWEKYLVYGATLGISLKALSEMPINFPASEFNRSGLYVTGMSSGSSSLRIGEGVGSIGESFAGLTSAFTSLGSSFQSFGAHGTGSSGGFSGGGGGGRGGGGGGGGGAG